MPVPLGPMEPRLSPRTRASLAQLDEAYMPSRCRVLRESIVTAGGTTDFSEPVLIAGPVACRLHRSGNTSREASVMGRGGDEPPATLCLPLGTPVLDRDIVEVTTWAGDTGPAQLAQVQRFDIEGDPWIPDYGSSLHLLGWRKDERHGG